jgi:Fur family iron response transcriptional regulator|tara:strand:+ start:687 stop:1103 length:417 start_codon:yes stop_codon:yes gene_type:complete
MENNSIFIEKLRSSGLRPTKQRLKICKLLFDRKKTFHFTISDLSKIIKKETDEKISLATIYNTVHSFKKKGYLKEISLNSEKSYFDTNASNHHHFIDESTNKIVDLHVDEISNIKIKKNLPGKKVKSVEVLVKLENSN